MLILAESLENLAEIKKADEVYLKIIKLSKTEHDLS